MTLLISGLIQNDTPAFEFMLKQPKTIQTDFLKTHLEQTKSKSLSLSTTNTNNILINWLVNTIEFGSNLLFDAKQINILLAICYEIHVFNVSSCFANKNEGYKLMRKLLLTHSVNQAPWRMAIFCPEDLRKIADFFVENYFRHFNVYKYWVGLWVRFATNLSYKSIKKQKLNFFGPPHTTNPLRTKSLLQLPINNLNNILIIIILSFDNNLITV